MFILIVLAVVSSPAENRKILIDLSHDERVLRTPSKNNVPCFDIFKDVYDIVESYEEITYKNLQNYDILLVGMPQKSFDSSETDVIVRFVSNGGGLFLLGESEYDYRYSEPQFINSLSEMFGVDFDADALVKRNHTTVVQGQIHPVFQGIKKIFWAASGNITVKEPSIPLLHHEGGCLMAYCEYGEGRIIFLPDSDFFLFRYIGYEDNQQFVTNILGWLSEPGGPHLHYRELLDKGIPLLEKGKEQMDSGDFDLAKSTFIRSKGYLKRALAIYESDEIDYMIEAVESFIADAEIVIKAKSLFQEGKNLYESGEYASAVENLEKAQALFQSINVSSEECASLVKECKKEMESEEPPAVDVLVEPRPHVSSTLGYYLLFFVLVLGGVLGIVLLKRRQNVHIDDRTRIYR